VDDFKAIYERYTQLNSDAERYRPLWRSISQYVGIGVNTDYTKNNQNNKSQQLDQYIDDPTAALSVNQFGDYMVGIMWGTGDNAFKLVPSRYALELASMEELEPYYDFATDQTLYHMNHSEAGFNNCLRAYAYDQGSFGTSGIGTFPNKAFKQGVADNAFLFRQYGVDNMVIDEGKGSMIDIVYATYQWRTNRIVGEFCTDDGVVSKEKLAKLPKEIRQAWEKNDLNRQFTIIFGMYPRSDYNPKKIGKKGTKYCGVWFMYSQQGQNNPFGEEDFTEKPIAVARMIKVRGEVYGRSSGTMLISTIRAVNFMLTTAIEIVEKMANPSLGVFNNAIFGDSVLDTSPNGLTVFNSTLAQGQNPTFPVYDVGDPSALLKLIIPYLNEKVTTAFKVDALLDFSSAKEMTATESLQRYAIRGKSLAGILQQQKVECLEPTVRRCVSILYDLDQLGANPETMVDRTAALRKRGKDNRVMPQAVLDCIKAGRPWYEIRFNNELEKLTRTESVQALVQVINSITAIAALFPNIIEAVDWYKLLKDINNNLDANNQIIISETDFKKKIQAIAAQQQAMMAAQAGQAGAEIQKNTATANKNNAEAMNVTSR
jgi:hypothetical protein